MARRNLQQLRDHSTDRVLEYVTGRRIGRVLLRYVNGLRQHQVGRAAGAMAFYFFFASLPLLAVMAWLLARWIAEPSTHVDQVLMFLDLAPDQVRNLVGGQISRFSGSRATAAAPIVIFSALWLASSALQTVMGVLEQALHAHPRGFWKKRLIAFCSAIILVAGIPIGAAMIVWLAAPVDFLNALLGIEDRSRAGRIIAMLLGGVLITAAFAGFFRVSVSRHGVKRRLWPGAILTVVLASGASYGIGHFFGTIARFSAFFGSLAAVAVMLGWMWICSIAILMGAELNAQLEGLERPTILPRGASRPSRPRDGTDE